MRKAATVKVNQPMAQEDLNLLGYWAELDRIYAGLDKAQREIEATAGVPICIEKCGVCCSQSIQSTGVEAEYTASMLLGRNALIKPVIDACREWLTQPGKWTYGSKITLGRWKRLERERQQAINSRCCFLKEDKGCLLHFARPMVCRAYGVVHLPHPDCPRPLGLGESREARYTFNPDNENNPIRPRWDALLSHIEETQFSRQGFFPLMLFERLAADELAALLYDGKIPLVKAVVGIGQGYQLLWQEQMEKEWAAAAAYKSMEKQVPLEERDGKLVMAIKVKR